MLELFFGPGLTCTLILAVVLVNGWTDAPNAIATTVASGSISFHFAVFLSAISNFIGVGFISFTATAVSETIYSMVSFHGNRSDSVTALCAAMLSIILWAVLAWRFGIPTKPPLRRRPIPIPFAWGRPPM